MATIAPKSPPLTDPVDILLAEVAIRIQLSRTDYDKAVGRYKTINKWIERDESPLKNRIQVFYPQGSMAIGATIASKLRTDEFDIDVVAQLDIPEDVLPEDALDLLFKVIRGDPNSRYYRMAKRRTRCVTVDYSDDMHLDVTPMLRRAETTLERESWIFHHRPETPQEPGQRFIANPYGFAEWFKRNTPLDHAFANAFNMRASEYEQLQSLAKMADSEPVPRQEPPFHKSKAVIVLQLLKRWRNVQYDKRPGRRPPSIMIAKFVADAVNDTDRLSETLLYQAQHMLSLFRQHHDGRRLVRVVNPVCAQDVLTDRWPESLQDQAVFIHDLEMLAAKIECLVSGGDLSKMQEIMAELFGEKPTVDAVETFNKRTGNAVRSGQSRYRPDVGSLTIPAMAMGTSGATPSGSRAAPRHTFYGGERHRQ